MSGMHGTINCLITVTGCHADIIICLGETSFFTLLCVYIYIYIYIYACMIIIMKLKKVYFIYA